MKAITIWQPWASLIMAGAKPFEWRNWPAPRWSLGRIVIHAGTRPMRIAEINELFEDIDAAQTSLVAGLALPILERAHLGLPLGAGLGTAVLGVPRRATEIYPGDDRCDPKKWGWPLRDPEPFEPFVPARGFQGFWEWRHDVPGRAAA